MRCVATTPASVSGPAPAKAVRCIIVDADRHELRDISDFHTFLYRLAVHSVIYGVLITLRGFFPKMKTESKNDSDNKNKAKRKRKQNPRTT